MPQVILEGFGLGLVVSFSFGPAFWAVLQTGIDRGFKWGLLLSIGILLSDVTFIAISYIGASNLFSNDNKVYIGIIGGIILIIFGLFTFFKKPDILRRRSPKYKTPKVPKPHSLVIKGYFLNLANPFIFFFWLAAMSFITAHAEEGNFNEYVITFFGSSLITIFLSDLLKCYVGYRFKRLLRPRIVFWINRGIGVILAVSGVVLIYRVFYPF
jgi:threonine/homoserine/homoserine lactone efflux protein